MSKGETGRRVASARSLHARRWWRPSRAIDIAIASNRHTLPMRVAVGCHARLAARAKSRRRSDGHVVAAICAAPATRPPPPSGIVPARRRPAAAVHGRPVRGCYASAWIVGRGRRREAGKAAFRALMAVGGSLSYAAAATPDAARLRSARRKRKRSDKTKQQLRLANGVWQSLRCGLHPLRHNSFGASASARAAPWAAPASPLLLSTGHRQRCCTHHFSKGSQASSFSTPTLYAPVCHPGSSPPSVRQTRSRLDIIS